MAFEIIMPQLGLTMEEGTVSSWLKHEGDAVKAGEAILEITTDKLTNEVTSEHDGVLLKIVAQEGEAISVRRVNRSAALPRHPRSPLRPRLLPRRSSRSARKRSLLSAAAPAAMLRRSGLLSSAQR